MDVQLRHLRWFILLAEDLHFGSAARELHITQSALSKAVARLEKEVGTPLLTRTSRSVALTPAGRAFKQAVILVVEEADRAVSAARHAAAQVAPPVRLGYVIPVADVLTGLLEALRRSAPGTEVQLSNFPYSDLTAGLRSRETDVAFTVPHLDIPDLCYVPLFEDERVVLLSAHHRLAGRTRLELADLEALVKTDVWLLPPEPPVGTESFRRFASAADALSGRVPARTVTFATNEDLAQRIVTGEGVGMGFRSLVERYALPGTVPVPVRGLAPASMGLAWRASCTHSSLQAVVEVARSLPVERGS